MLTHERADRRDRVNRSLKKSFMKVNIRLYGLLRDVLPAEKKGRDLLDLAEGSTVQDALCLVGIRRPVITAVNELHEATLDHVLQDGDQMVVFIQAAGG